MVCFVIRFVFKKAIPLTELLPYRSIAIPGAAKRFH